MQLQSGHPLDETSIACITRDLLHAVDYLHSEGKIHRDIKGFVCVYHVFCFYNQMCFNLLRIFAAANILLTENGDVKVFLFSFFFNDITI